MTAAKLAGRHVLIAQDQYLLASVLIDLVRLHGGTVVGPVSTEDDARRLADGTRVDVAVLDIELANGPCVALVEELRTKGVPVILTTTGGLSAIPDSLSGLSVLSKPFDSAVLAERIAEHCGAAQPKAS